jgi:hypothetical protein
MSVTIPQGAKAHCFTCLTGTLRLRSGQALKSCPGTKLIFKTRSSKITSRFRNATFGEPSEFYRSARFFVPTAMLVFVWLRLQPVRGQPRTGRRRERITTTRHWPQRQPHCTDKSCKLLILWWALQDSNLRLPPCEGGTLPLS